MSIRTDMITAAGLAVKLLGPSAECVERFFLSNLTPAGGFADRSGMADLYYTVFGLEGLIALGASLPDREIASFLDGFGCGDSLDIVHLASLARCRADIRSISGKGKSAGGNTGGGNVIGGDINRAISERLFRFRCPDGGFSHLDSAGRSTIYGCFLAVCAFEDLNLLVPVGGEIILRCVDSLRSPLGGYFNQTDTACRCATTSAAALTLNHYLGGQPDKSTVDWLLGSCFRDGGFCTADSIPMPDLLSTAVVLFALSVCGIDLTAVRQPCLDFIESLWTGDGAFCSSWADEILDVEHTWYGLVALGAVIGR